MADADTPVLHLVFLRFKERDAARAAAAHAAAQRLLLLIPGVLSARFGLNDSPRRADGFTHQLAVVFASRHHFEGWGPHPLHALWGATHVAPYLDGPGASSIVKIDMAAPVMADPAAADVVDHTVFFTMTPRFDDDVCAAAQKLLPSTICKVPGVLSASFGKAFMKQGEANYALHVKLASREALAGYGPHPLHMEWAQKFAAKHYCRHIRCVDSASPARRSRL